MVRKKSLKDSFDEIDLEEIKLLEKIHWQPPPLVGPFGLFDWICLLLLGLHVLWLIGLSM